MQINSINNFVILLTVQAIQNLFWFHITHFMNESNVLNLNPPSLSFFILVGKSPQRRSIFRRPPSIGRADTTLIIVDTHYVRIYINILLIYILLLKFVIRDSCKCTNLSLSVKLRCSSLSWGGVPPPKPPSLSFFVWLVYLNT